MTILFYLPAITPRWFARLFAPLIEAIAADHDVHILAPALWSGTGLGESELALCAHLPSVRYHVVNDPNHPTMRTAPVEREAIVAFVRALAPDYVLCRSADFETVKRFPGIVRHITEAAADPLRFARDTIHLTTTPFDHGVMPDLNRDQVARLEALIEPFWDRLLPCGPNDTACKQAQREWAGLPANRPSLFLPLEFEHEENFFIAHRVGPLSNAQLIQDLAEQIGDRAFLAITNHPLSVERGDISAVRETVEAYPNRMRLLPSRAPDRSSASRVLMGCTDGVVLGDSKLFSLAGAMGTTLIRRSRFASGEWLNPYDDVARFLSDLEQGQPQKADPTGARRWLAFHTANNLINITHPDFTGQDLLDRMEKPLDPSRWDRNFAFFSQDW